MENMREYWAREAEMMRDKSAVLGAVNQDFKQPETDKFDGVKGRYIFDIVGKFSRFEATGKPAVLQVGEIIYNFNDPLTDVGSIEYNRTKPPKVFGLIRFIYGYSDEAINRMMELSNVKKGRSILSIAKASVGGELDFSVWHFSKTIEKVQPGYWDPETEILKDKGPLFVFPNHLIVYNLLDAGNWLWGNAMKRMGFSLADTLKYAKTYDRHDTAADLRAISAGWAAAPK